MIIAHQYDDGKMQSLEEHLKNVSDLSSLYADGAGLNKEHMRQIANMHDYGKCSVEFQDYITGRKESTVSHSDIGGALLAKDDFIGALCVLGHHSGLPDFGTSQDKNTTFMGRCLNAPKKGLHFQWEAPSINRFFPERTRGNKDTDKFDAMLETRMYLSCLVDADWQDSAAFVEKQNFDCWDKIYNNFYDFVSKKFGNATISEINGWRSEIFNDCKNVGRSGTARILSLSAPTGGGKTFASMAFALERVKRGDARRIIYCIPYTSIICQNAEEYRNAMGVCNVVENHSLAEYKEDSEENAFSAEQYKKWAVDNWDAPVVMTTNVQFFESLFAARTRRIRKLHNIAGSVIIFDEAQMIPRQFFTCFREMLKLLVEKYGCTVMLCTATQPAFNIGEIENEILGSPELMHERFKRVKAENIGDMLDFDSLANRLNEKIQEGKSTLCIVNRRDDARELYRKMKDFKTVTCYHLSLNMCAAHRKKVLDKVKEDLRNRKVICLISTSLVEAGVDISFTVGYRELTGLDRMVQAAGRVNRNAEQRMGELYVFRLVDRRYDTAEAVESESLLSSGKDIFSREAVDEYFKNVYSYLFEKDFDKNGVMEASEGVNFRIVEDRVRLIDNDQVPILVPYDEAAEKTISLLFQGIITKKGWNLLRNYTVSIYRKQLDDMVKQKALDGTEDGIYILNDVLGWYDKECGLLKDFVSSACFV